MLPVTRSTNERSTASQAALDEARQRIGMLESVNASLRRTIAQLQGEVAVTRQLAYHDALTGLPNRHLLRDRLSQGVHRAAREGRRVALLMLDLDDFKSVNDTLGHAAGDELLVEVAARLRATTGDSCRVFRFAGDEFVVLASGIHDDEEAAAIGERLRVELAEPMLLESGPLVVTCSVGVARATGDDSVDGLLHNADVAMYEAKRRGKGATAVFGALPSGQG